MAKKSIMGFDAYDFTKSTDDQEDALVLLIQDPSYSVEKGWKVTVKQLLQCFKPSFLAAKFKSVAPSRSHSLASTSGLSTVGDVLKLLQGADFVDTNFPAKTPTKETQLISPDGKVLISKILALVKTSDVKNAADVSLDTLLEGINTDISGKAAKDHQHTKEADIPNLSASKITSGTFNTNRIPDLVASKITSGVFNIERIPYSEIEGKLLFVTDKSVLDFNF